ncbi:MAG TPA: zonular occludens toxin domain-containing protein, partial [Actinopolymorphaceae bacterium]|nr:zonular occludens toxin domain-containing protein [Actinopolymorphaceae bacterium]
RAYPLQMYVGRNGSGKSLCAVYDTLPDLDAGTPVLSTVRLLDYLDPRPCLDPVGCDRPDWHHDPAVPHNVAHPAYVPFTQWEQLLSWQRGVVIMDEITGVADSNESSALPSAVGNMLAQMRRTDISIRITALNFIRAHKRIREAVNAVTRCRSAFPVTVQDADGYERMWRTRRLVKAITYDAQSLPVDDHTDHAYEQADVLCRGRLWVPACEARQAYDTFSPVLVVGTVTDAGRCAYCGGTRRAPECSCSDYQARRRSRRGEDRRRGSDEDRTPAHRHDLEAVAG